MSGDNAQPMTFQAKPEEVFPALLEAARRTGFQYLAGDVSTGSAVFTSGRHLLMFGEKITVPTMYVWSDADTAVLEKGARDSGRYVSGEYRFETLHGSHWILDEQPDAVADLLLEWLAAHPI